MKKTTKLLGLLLLLSGLAFTSCGGQTTAFNPYTDYDITQAFLVGTFVNKVFPSDWTYVPDNPSYPDPSWCKSAEPYELKFKLVGMGVISPVFEAHDDVKVAICVQSTGKINETDTGTGSDHIFQVDALDAEGQVLETLFGDDVEGYHVTEVTFAADSIAQVKVSMVGYYTYESQKQALGICKIALFGEASAPVQTKSLVISDKNLGGSNLPTSWNDTDTTETSRIGTYDVEGTEFKVNYLGKWRVSTSHSELGSKSDPASSLRSLSNVKVVSITIDFYSAVACDVYASNDGTGTPIEGASQTASANEGSVVYSYSVNSNAWSLTMTGNAWFYSITFVIS